MASGIQSLAMSLDILPRLRVLKVNITQVDGVSDLFIKELFSGVVVNMDDLQSLETLSFESETQLMAVDQPLK